MLSAVTVSVGKDTYLTNHSGQNPEANLGGLDELRIYKDSAEVYRTLVGADISSLNAAATVNSAALQLYHSGGFSFDPVPMEVTVYTLAASWEEGTGVLDSTAGDGASWLNAAPGTPWATPGGDLGTVVSTVTLPDAATPGWISIDITSAVQAWHSGSANNGLALVVTSGGSYTQYNFASSEAADAALRPQLTVDLTDPVTTPVIPNEHASHVAHHVHSELHVHDDGHGVRYGRRDHHEQGPRHGGNNQGRRLVEYIRSQRSNSNQENGGDHDVQHLPLQQALRALHGLH